MECSINNTYDRIPYFNKLYLGCTVFISRARVKAIQQSSTKYVT